MSYQAGKNEKILGEGMATNYGRRRKLKVFEGLEFRFDVLNVFNYKS